MRRLVRWTIVTLGIAALVRWLRGRRGDRARHAPGEPGEPAGDPADELRRKLAESRSGDGVEATSPDPVETVEERRADVHDQARATLSEMTPDDR